MIRLEVLLIHWNSFTGCLLEKCAEIRTTEAQAIVLSLELVVVESGIECVSLEGVECIGRELKFVTTLDISGRLPRRIHFPVA